MYVMVADKEIKFTKPEWDSDIIINFKVYSKRYNIYK